MSETGRKKFNNLIEHTTSADVRKPFFIFGLCSLDWSYPSASQYTFIANVPTQLFGLIVSPNSRSLIDMRPISTQMGLCIYGSKKKV